MSAPAPPTIPPRPVRHEKAVAQGVSKLPDIPPRPISKRMERSISPGARYPQSPLNEPYSMTRVKSTDPILPPRAPSVSHLPIAGEEGLEYANIQYEPEQPVSALAQDAAAQTRSVGDDLHLHAPKPSLPTATASAQVEPLTRTDSAAAAAAQGLDEIIARTRSRGSFSRPDSAGSGFRRRSIDVHDDHGHAGVGLRVPINPFLGDVQAPTPGGLSPQVTGGSAKQHGRKKSGIDNFRPPDAYGLHGHGILPPNKFEHEWYAKHPDELEHEEAHGHGVYEGLGSGRGNFALSSNELNKLVRDTASRGSGFGTAENIQSYPDEQIGYIASEEYQRSQQNTPHPDLSRVQTAASVESPLREASFPAEDAGTAEIRRSKGSLSVKSDHHTDNEGEDYHIDSPARRYNKITGGEETIDETAAAKPYVSSEFDGEPGYTVPILAEDEVAKSFGGEYLQPAVSPRYERKGSSYYDDHGSGAHSPSSRPSSRPGSIYNLHSANHSLSRFLSHQDEREHMHTPLEDVAEYEPLFPDDDGKKSLSHTERFKSRPISLQKRFPSMDVWEDAPNSVHYSAEVSTPDLPSTAEEKRLEVKPQFEHPEKEAARKGEPSEEEKQRLILKEDRLRKSKFAPHLRDDMPSRPGLAQRFPSQDIWEDSPDSSQLITTVGSIDNEDGGSPVESTKPPIPARPAKNRLGEVASSSQVPPNIPARPPKRLHAVPPADAKLTDAIPLSKETSPTELKKVPSIPDRPKPQIPPRPAKKPGDDGLTKVTSAGSSESAETVTSPPLTKAKPQIPPRPAAAGNIAGIKGNFMSDLNKKLGLGPPKEKEPELEPKEVKPLEDARKGRARGPQRRAPAKSPVAAATVSKPVLSFSMFTPQSMWQIDDEGSLNVGAKKVKGPALEKNIVQIDSQSTWQIDDEGSLDVGSKKARESATEAKIAQIDHAAPADDPLPPTLETTPKAEKEILERPTDAPEPVATGLAKNTAGEATDPAPSIDEENVEGELTRKTTASTISGQPLEREETDPNADAIPASRQTTATDSQNNDPEEKLERIQTEERIPEESSEKIAEEEPIKIRNEQVNAAAPTRSSDSISHSLDTVESEKQGSTSEDTAQAVTANTGEDAPKEPMTEQDVNYKKLEEMTAKADGKLHADEEPENTGFSSRKIVD